MCVWLSRKSVCLGRENQVTVVYWDKTELKATLLRKHDSFYMLATNFQKNRHVVDLLVVSLHCVYV
jgi:hypothetical protein